MTNALMLNVTYPKLQSFPGVAFAFFWFGFVKPKQEILPYSV